MFRENKKIVYILVSITFLFALLITGYAFNLRDQSKSPDKLRADYKEFENEIKAQAKKDDLQASLADENIVGVKTRIIYKAKYLECGDEITEVEKPTQDMIGLDRKAFEDYAKENLSKWEINMYSKDEIILFRVKDTLCKNHYVVGEKDGNIAIFTIDEKGQRQVHKIFKDATISTIREENQKRLKQGIVVESEEEAIQVLEDFIS